MTQLSQSRKTAKTVEINCFNSDSLSPTRKRKKKSPKTIDSRNKLRFQKEEGQIRGIPRVHAHKQQTKTRITNIDYEKSILIKEVT